MKLLGTSSPHSKTKGIRGNLEISGDIGCTLVAMDRSEEAIEQRLQCLEVLRARFPYEQFLIAGVLKNLAMACYRINDIPRALSYAEESHLLMHRLKWTQGEGEVLWVLGMTLLLNGEFKDSAKLFADAAKLLLQVGDLPQAAAAYTGMGTAHGRLRQLTACREAFTHALQIYEEFEDVEEQAKCLRNLGIALSQWNEPECVQWYQKARELFLRLDLKLPAGLCLLNEASARLSCKVSAPRELLDMFSKARRELQAAEDELNAMRALFWEGCVLIALSDSQAAARAFRTSMKSFQNLGDADFAEHSRIMLDNVLPRTSQPSALEDNSSMSQDETPRSL